MSYKGFKIGDKVKLAFGETWSMGTKEGTVTGFKRNSTPRDSFIMVMYDGYNKDYDLDDDIGFPFKAGEIVHSIKVGQQLLFSFMEEE